MVWRHLVSSLGPDDVVLANQRLTDESKDHELDLVVLMADVGIVVAEVKGGSVTVDDQGRWWQGTGDRRRRIHPVDQAREGKYALRHYVESDPRWRDSSRSRVRWAHAVVTPYTTVDEGFATSDCPRWAVHGRADLAELPQRLRAAAPQHGTGHRAPSGDDVDLL